METSAAIIHTVLKGQPVFPQLNNVRHHVFGIGGAPYCLSTILQYFATNPMAVLGVSQAAVGAVDRVAARVSIPDKDWKAGREFRPMVRLAASTSVMRADSPR